MMTVTILKLIVHELSMFVYYLQILQLTCCYLNAFCGLILHFYTELRINVDQSPARVLTSPPPPIASSANTTLSSKVMLNQVYLVGTLYLINSNLIICLRKEILVHKNIVCYT